MRLDELSLAYRNPYLFRLRPTFGEMRARHEERVAERTRIAQDLHDTVLQGIFSAAMQLDVAVDQLPANSPAKLRLTRVVELMRHAMEEGRNAVRGLRSSNSDSDDLGKAFSRIPQDLGMEVQIDFRVVVLGSAREVRPLVRDEVYHIGRELLVNAFRHSRASSIEVELEYGPKRFRIVVRDNGCGIDPQVLRTGREGHWGLPGMRERAERVGARVRVWSRAAAGTEVALSVPNYIAFESRMVEKLAPGKEIEVITVNYAPGAVDVIHWHDAHAVVYVLEGEVEMQVRGGMLRRLGPGQVFYESPEDVHTVSRNASKTKPAKFVVFFIKNEGAPILTPVH